ncbi:Protein phosphatase PTC7 like protein [Argiope bruennichi]|uniref:Protein phosphatase n=1 Tax=Argiope bruennichi TaxID=94029 RepID=A0A8T0E8G0_ARGBR|nr:Protein phosphatase PTC7 like protein [Argiope bruennichi]
MQSVLVYGRFLTRALINGVYNYSSSTEAAVNRKRERDFRLLAVACGFPKVSSRFSALLNRGRYGDDASFFARYKTADVLGVADGVGGWRNYGIDPSLFSYTLMETCERLLILYTGESRGGFGGWRNYGIDPSLFSYTLMETCERLVVSGRFNPRNPGHLIAASYYELLENKEQILGSSTACVVVLNKTDQMLYTANMGDSPDTADTSSLPVQEGDFKFFLKLRLFFTIFQNLYCKTTKKTWGRDHNMENLQKMVNSLAFQAHRLAFDANYLSPFSKRARENGIDVLGGKPDDVTVLLAAVTNLFGEKSDSIAAVVAQHTCSSDHG